MRKTTRHYHNTNITVTENRAVTDESVKLLNEFEQKAKDNLIGKYEFVNNEIGLEYTIMFFDEYSFSGSYNYVLIIVINGIKHELNGKIDKYEYRDMIEGVGKKYTSIDDFQNWFSYKLSVLITEQLMKNGNFFIKI